jgi:predicted transporter
VSGVRRGARTVVKWFAALYVVAIVVAVFLAGEGIFRLKNIANSDDCSKKGVTVAATDCVGNSNSLDAHRALGFLLVVVSILFLIVALVAWLPNATDRVISIVAPILTFLQVILAGIGGWVGGLHPVNAFLVLFLYGWLFYRLRKGETESSRAAAALG